jgi:hypothetical protein
MPRSGDPNLRRAVVPPSLVTAVELMDARIRELRNLNGQTTEVTEGHIVGLTEAKAFVLDAVVAEAGNPHSPL